MSIKMIKKNIPIFEMADAQSRRELLHFWGVFFHAVERSRAQSSHFAQLLRHEDQTSDEFGLWPTLLGLKELKNWDIDFKYKILKIYQEYIQWRGTLRGLRMLLECLLPGIQFAIHQRECPVDAHSLGLTRLNTNRRLLPSLTEAKSLTVEIGSSLNTEERARIYALIQKELPVGIQLYLRCTSRDVIQAELKKEKNALGSMRIGEVFGYVE